MREDNNAVFLTTTFVITGVGWILSSVGRGVISGRMLADPLPLILSIAQIGRGFLYWNWKNPLFHLLFGFGLVLLTLSFLTIWGIRKQEILIIGPRVVRLALGFNIGIVALQQIDALVVGIYYLLSGFVSIIWTGFLAEQMASWLVKIRP